MMHTKSGEGRTGIHGGEEVRKEGRKEREGENGQKSKNHPREEEKEAEREQKGAKRERENENVGSTVFCSRATLKMYFFASRPIYPEDKGHRVSHTDVHTLNRVNELIITPRLPELVVK